MAEVKKGVKIKIVKNGPYIVTGSIPLSEKIITPKGNSYVYEDGREFETKKMYALCRCGASKNHPYCDGSHEDADFDGTEVASRDTYDERARIFKGPGIDLMDDGRCAVARFCHKEHGSVWELVKKSDDEHCKQEVIKGAVDCPTGRLVAVEKDGTRIEPEYEPSIEMLQDPEKKVSGPFYVKGNVPILASDGEIYEIRNRVGLCRCGNSKDTPFCDGRHIKIEFNDHNEESDNI